MAATHPLKKRSQALLRKHGSSLKNLYKDSKDIESDEQDVMVKEIADGYLLVFSEEEPPIAEVNVEDLDDYVDDPSDYFGGLGAEIISIQEKGIVGTCSCRIYYFSEMAGLFSANYILTRLDDECVDKAAVGLELRRRKQLRYLFTEDADTNLLHIQWLRIKNAHRGKDLGLKTLEVLIDYTANSLSCGYAIMQPCPLPYEPGDVGNEDNKKIFSEGRKKLFDYYQRLGFTKPSPRSKYLYKETPS